MIYTQLYFLSFTILLAAKDGDIYHLVKITRYASDKIYLDRWHIKGAIIHILLIVVGYYVSGWEAIPAGLLIRLAIYDLIFNKVAGLPYANFGTVNFWDRFFTKIFGSKGAIKKSICFLIALAIFNILNAML